jgi:hypothetical protein
MSDNRNRKRLTKSESDALLRTLQDARLAPRVGDKLDHYDESWPVRITVREVASVSVSNWRKEHHGARFRISVTLTGGELRYRGEASKHMMLEYRGAGYLRWHNAHAHAARLDKRESKRLLEQLTRRSTFASSNQLRAALAALSSTPAWSADNER